jgi:hypothetical protein
MKNECSAIFPGQRTRIPINCDMLTGIDVVMPDSAACYKGTREALLFRLPY